MFDTIYQERASQSILLMVSSNQLCLSWLCIIYVENRGCVTFEKYVSWFNKSHFFLLIKSLNLLILFCRVHLVAKNRLFGYFFSFSSLIKFSNWNWKQGFVNFKQIVLCISTAIKWNKRNKLYSLFTLVVSSKQMMTFLRKSLNLSHLARL